MLIEQPTKGQRILARWGPSQARICDYDCFDFRLWGVKQWKAMPPHSTLLAEVRLKFGKTRQELM